MKEISGKVQKKNQSLPTTLKMQNEIISDKNAIVEELNISPNLADKMPQVSKTFHQNVFSPVDP